MKILCILVIWFNFIIVTVWGQRKIIDEAACRSLERLEQVDGRSCLLSANGSFMFFKTYSENGGSETILKNLKLGVEIKFASTYNEKSLEGDRMFSFQLPGDSLVIFDTQKASYIYLTGVKNYFIIKSDTMDVIAYFMESAGRKVLAIWNIKNGKRLELPNVYIDKYWFNKLGTALLVGGESGLIYISLRDLKSTFVTSGTNAENAALSDSGDKIAYISREINGYELRYFNKRSGATYLLLGDSSSYLDHRWMLDVSGLSFDKDGDNIFFKISQSNKNYKNSRDTVITSDVNIWSYKDLYLQPKQQSMLFQRPAFTAMINVQNRKILQIESDELALEPLGGTGEFVVVTTSVNENEFYWNGQKKKMFLISTKTGKMKLITESQYPSFRFIGISPNNRFVVWFDGADGNYYSYNIKSNKISNISRFVDGSLRMLNQRQEAAGLINANPYEGQYWINNSAAIIVNSKNDIWQLDPLGIKEPICLTNEYGRTHNIRFRLVDADESPVKFKSNVFLAWAFDNRLKQNGFWEVSVGKSKDPVKLIMSNDTYFFYPLSTVVSSSSAVDPALFKPIKASKAKLFVVRKMNSFNAPNLYSTVDFKKFKKITDVDLDIDYPGISTKLITWSLPDGQQAEGILHKPEDFDSTQKYPIIFNYYERRSECLNVFRTPELSGHNINIPWYVSRGYLVFEPDFYYERSRTAKSVIISVESALVELFKIPYIDQSKMGIQGQSHGGYETNILATSTHLFAAACEMAGFTNIISEYGSVRPGGHNNQMAADLGQRNLGVFPWDHPEVFIENSPVFHVSNMTTPLLMVHNKDDGAVLFSQAIELYLSMRRLGKRVWLLQYDGEGHALVEPNNKLDYTIRMQQFFDHYLKGTPAPVWMSEGIPASLKGVVSGLQYRTSLVGEIDNALKNEVGIKK